jgi:hypothetical protein
LSQLKVQLASKEVELDFEHQGRQDSERAIRAQVIEAEQRRDKAIATLWESSGKSKGLKKCEGIPSSYALFSFISYLYNSVLILHDLFLLLRPTLHGDKQKLLGLLRK